MRPILLRRSSIPEAKPPGARRGSQAELTRVQHSSTGALGAVGNSAPAQGGAAGAEAEAKGRDERKDKERDRDKEREKDKDKEKDAKTTGRAKPSSIDPEILEILQKLPGDRNEHVSHATARPLSACSSRKLTSCRIRASTGSQVHG
jgi:hypothetical protein